MPRKGGNTSHPFYAWYWIIISIHIYPCTVVMENNILQDMKVIRCDLSLVIKFSIKARAQQLEDNIVRIWRISWQQYNTCLIKFDNECKEWYFMIIRSFNSDQVLENFLHRSILFTPFIDTFELSEGMYIYMGDWQTPMGTTKWLKKGQHFLSNR